MINLRVKAHAEQVQSEKSIKNCRRHNYGFNGLDFKDSFVILRTPTDVSLHKARYNRDRSRHKKYYKRDSMILSQTVCEQIAKRG